MKNLMNAPSPSLQKELSNVKRFNYRLAVWIWCDPTHTVWKTFPNLTADQAKDKLRFFLSKPYFHKARLSRTVQSPDGKYVKLQQEYKSTERQWRLKDIYFFGAPNNQLPPELCKGWHRESPAQLAYVDYFMAKQSSVMRHIQIIERTQGRNEARRYVVEHWWSLPLSVRRKLGLQYEIWSYDVGDQ